MMEQVIPQMSVSVRAVCLIFALSLLPVSPSQAATKCYWRTCEQGCRSGDIATLTKYRNDRWACMEWCCSPKDAKIQQQDGTLCRAKCSGKGSAYDGYFQCMRKCQEG